MKAFDIAWTVQRALQYLNLRSILSQSYALEQTSSNSDAITQIISFQKRSMDIRWNSQNKYN